MTTDPGLGPEEIDTLGEPTLDAETFAELIEGPDRGLDEALTDLRGNPRWEWAAAPDLDEELLAVAAWMTPVNVFKR